MENTVQMGIKKYMSLFFCQYKKISLTTTSEALYFTLSALAVLTNSCQGYFLYFLKLRPVQCYFNF